MEAMFYSVGEMAGLLGITERSVYRLNKQIPGYCKIGGRVYYNRQTFQKMTLGIPEPKEKIVSVTDRHGLI